MKALQIREQAAKATKWSSVTEIVIKLISVFTNMILARLLAPEAFGVIATVTMITSFADLFTDAGFQKYLTQHDFKNEKELNDSTNVAFWTNLILSLTLWGVISLFNDKLAELVGNPGLGNVIIIASVSIPLTSFSSIQTARFKKDFDFKTIFYVRLVTMLTPFFVTIPIAYFQRSFWALVYGTIATNGLTALILTIKSKWKPKFFYSFKLLKEMFSFSWWILLESISTWLTSYIGVFIVGKFLSVYYVGLYKTSMTTVNQIISLISAATSMPLFVALSKLKNNNAEMQNIYRKYIQAVGVFVIPLGVGLWMYRYLATEILLGSQWTEAAEFIGLWGLTSSFSLILGTYCNGYFNAKGKTYLSFLAQILHLVVLVPALYIVSPLGFKSIYITRSLLRIELIIVELLIMLVALKFPIWKLFADMIPATICTCMMYLFNLILCQIGSSLVWQLFSVVLCIIFYFGIMYVFFEQCLSVTFEAFGIKKITEKNKNIIYNNFSAQRGKYF